MSKTICPGQDTRFWQPEDIFEVECGQCGGPVEFFKDEASRRCSKCGARVQNPKLHLGCAQWCEHAEACLGYDPKGAGGEGSDEMTLVDRLIEAMKDRFGRDQDRITHALLVLEQAQKRLAEESASPPVVLAAALLHDIGAAEGDGDEEARAPVLRRIMREAGLDAETIEAVCRIVESHHGADDDEDTPESRIIRDVHRHVETAGEAPAAQRVVAGS